jgi:hypothetical protein
MSSRCELLHAATLSARARVNAKTSKVRGIAKVERSFLKYRTSFRGSDATRRM